MMWRIGFVRVELPSDLSDSLRCAPTLRSQQQHDMRPDIWPNEWRDCPYTDLAFRCLKVESDSNRSSIWSQVRFRCKHVGMLQRLCNYCFYLSCIHLCKEWVLYCEMRCNAVCWIPWNGYLVFIYVKNEFCIARCDAMQSVGYPEMVILYSFM